MRVNRDFCYEYLEAELAAQQWQQAEIETVRLLKAATNTHERQPFSLETIRNIPCRLLQTIDYLWREYSDDWFGLSIQQQIWQDCGAPVDYRDNWDEFGDRLGWRQAGIWLPYTQLNFELGIHTPRGHLPDLCLWGRRRAFLFQRYQSCALPQR